MERWFKFFSADYLTDSKIWKLNTAERSCWVTLLCLADMAEIPGEISRLDERHLMEMAGLSPEEQAQTVGILKKLESLEMLKRNDNDLITIVNFRKRQGTALTSYERVKKHREMKRFETDETKETDDNVNDNTRREEKRVEKKRINKESTPSQNAEEFFKNPEPIILQILERGLPEQPVRQEVAKFISYWTEPNKSGTQQRWQMEKAFEVRRRLGTWFANTNKFSGQKPDRRIIG